MILLDFKIHKKQTILSNAKKWEEHWEAGGVAEVVALPA
jgi:hypothetical protein